MRYPKAILLLFLPLICTASAVRADKTIPFIFDKSLTIEGSCTYNYLRVIDNRPDKNNIGLVGYKYLTTTLPLGATMTNFAAQLLSKAQTGNDTLLLVLEDFRIEGSPAKKKFGTFYFRGKFYLGGNNLYRMAGDIDSIYEVTGNFQYEAQRAAELKCFQYLSAIAHSKMPEDVTTVTLQEAIESAEREKKAFPIYGAGAFNKGVYYARSEFLNHKTIDTPLIQNDLYGEGKVTKSFFYYSRGKNKRRGEPVEGAFAVFNGKDWYRNAGNAWYKMHYENGDFYSVRYLEGHSGQSAATGIAMGFMFGVTGVALAYAMDILPGTNGQTYVPYKVRLNPVDGKFYPVKRLQ